jgi:hypothetical protein
MAFGRGFLTYTLIQHRDPTIICHEETHLRPSHSLNLCGFTAHPYDHPDRQTGPVEGRLPS